jgi:uncharacterized protein (DUF433 family)
MSATSTQYVYLAPNPKSAYRQLFVKGTRIPARAIYSWYACEEPRSPEEIAADYDLPVEAVKEAIAYCESNPPELLEDYARQESLMQARGMKDPGYKLHGKPKPLSPQDRTRLRRL